MAVSPVPTRERILYATAELFRRQGYSGTGLKQVVAEAKAPFGSLYHHFPGGKHQLAEEVIRGGGAFFQAVATAAYDREATPEASAARCSKRLPRRSRRPAFQDACPIATVALEVASTNEDLRRATAEVFEQWIGALTERLGDRARALAVLSALEGAFILCRAQRSVEPMLSAGEMAAAYAAGPGYRVVNG